jgi:hypothetical protein
MYGYDNASLWGRGSRGAIELFSCTNKRRLGDTANDLLKISDSLFVIIVSTSNEILKIDSRGSIVSSVQLNGPGHFLKKGCIVNDSTIAITDVYADKVYLLNHITMSIDSLSIQGLCAPDGIAYGNGSLVIANSGYGIFRKDEMNASTLAIYELEAKRVRFQKTGVNPQHILYDSHENRWFIQYAHLTTMPDSLGGMYILNKDFKELFHVRGSFVGSPVYVMNEMYALNGKAIVRIPKTSNNVDTVIVNRSNDQWYRLSTVKDKLMICNARNYMVPGTIMVLELGPLTVQSECSVGINPSVIIGLK